MNNKHNEDKTIPLHFLSTKQGYQYLTSEVYDELEHKDHILEEVETKVSDRELEALQNRSWTEVRAYIKDTIDGLLNK